MPKPDSLQGSLDLLVLKILSRRSGKPVIFYCNHERRHRFYRDVHPLSRLIEFETGVAVGAMVTEQLSGSNVRTTSINRNQAETFPYGFFKWWRLNTNIGRFEQF